MGKRWGEFDAELRTRVRFLAWLSAVPEPDRSAPKVSSAPVDERTRQQRYEDIERREGERPPSLDPPLPFHPELQELIDLLFDIGPTAKGEVLDWSDIQAWSALTGSALDPWICSLMRSLSAEFVSTRHAARQPNYPRPGGAPPLTEAQALAQAAAREAYWDRQMEADAAKAPKPAPVPGRHLRARRQPKPT